MMRCYVTPNEFYDRFPQMTVDDGLGNGLVPSENVTKFLGAATEEVREDMEILGSDPRGFMSPLHFSAVEPFEKQTFASETTSSGIDGKNSNRLVVEVTTVPTTDTYVTLYGTYDTVEDNDTVWVQCQMLDKTPFQLRISDYLNSARFVDEYNLYRYVLTVGESITAAMYLVDSASIDRLILYKTLEIACESVIETQSDRVGVLYEMAKGRYVEYKNRLVADYDSDKDGTPDQEQTRNKVFITR